MRCLYLRFYLYKSMVIYPSVSLSTSITNVPFNPKSTTAQTVEDSSVKDWSVLNDESSKSVTHSSSRTVKDSSIKDWSVIDDKSSQLENESSKSVERSPANALESQSKSSSCKQCQFCSHFELELTHWGRCSALSVLVPGQAPACILHEPCFSGSDMTVALTQLQRSTINDEALNAWESETCYQYSSADC